MRHLAPITGQQQQSRAHRHRQSLPKPASFVSFGRVKQHEARTERDQNRHRRVDDALRAQIRQRVVHVPGQAHRHAAVIKQVLHEINLDARTQRTVDRQIRRHGRADQRRAQQHPPRRKQRAAEPLPPPDKRQQAHAQPGKQADVRVFDQEHPARRRAEAQHAPARLFLRPRHRRQRQINANGQRRQRKFLRASALCERRAAAGRRRQQRHSLQRQPPFAKQAHRPPARIHRRRKAERLQRKHADEARIRNRRAQRIKYEQQRPLVVKQIPIRHQPARHAPPDGEIDIRIRPEVGRVQRRTARGNQ